MPGSPTAQLMMNVAIVSYGSSTLAIGVTLFAIYFLQQLRLA